MKLNLRLRLRFVLVPCRAKVGDVAAAPLFDREEPAVDAKPTDEPAEAAQGERLLSGLSRDELEVIDALNLHMLWTTVGDECPEAKLFVGAVRRAGLGHLRGLPALRFAELRTDLARLRKDIETEAPNEAEEAKEAEKPKAAEESSSYDSSSDNSSSDASVADDLKLEAPAEEAPKEVDKEPEQAAGEQPEQAGEEELQDDQCVIIPRTGLHAGKRIVATYAGTRGSRTGSRLLRFQWHCEGLCNPRTQRRCEVQKCFLPANVEWVRQPRTL